MKSENSKGVHGRQRSLEPVRCCQTRVRWHPFLRDDYHRALHAQDRFSEVIEDVVGPGMREVARRDLPRDGRLVRSRHRRSWMQDIIAPLDVSGRGIDSAGNLPFGFDE